MEDTAEVRHEYLNGVVVEMSGGSYFHSMIVANVTAGLHAALLGKPCHALDSNLKVGIGAARRFVYPDVTVICGGPQFDKRDPSGHTVINPRLIVEVLSPSTENYDRNDKFTGYRSLEAFEEYVLISQTGPEVQTYFRQSDGTWLFSPYIGVQGTVKLRSLTLELPLQAIYAGVEFAPDVLAEIDALAESENQNPLD